MQLTIFLQQKENSKQNHKKGAQLHSMEMFLVAKTKEKKFILRTEINE